MIPLGVIGGRRTSGVPLTATYRGVSRPSGVGSAPSAYTYAAAPIGAAAADRTVLVLVCWWAGGNRTLNGVTIGGVAATADLVHSGGVNAGFTAYRRVVTAGTTVDVVATMQDNLSGLAIAVWTVDGLIVPMSADNRKLVASGATADTVTATPTSTTGFAIGGFISRSSLFATTWTGVTERADSGTAQPSSFADGPTDGTPKVASLTFSPAPNNGQTRLGLIAYRRA